MARRGFDRSEVGYSRTVVRAVRLLVLVVLAFSALVGATAAPGATVVNQKLPFTGTFYNECADELIAVEGTVQTTSQVTFSGDRVHTSVDVRLAGLEGTALDSGARYTAMDVQNQQLNVDLDGAPAEFTDVRSHHLTRQGDDGTSVLGDDLRFHSIIHMTVNANGLVTVDKSEMRSDCR